MLIYGKYNISRENSTNSQESKPRGSKNKYHGLCCCYSTRGHRCECYETLQNIDGDRPNKALIPVKLSIIINLNRAF